MIKEQWGKLTDDDLAVIQGRRDQLEGKLQERYGYAKDEVRSEINDWLATLAGNVDDDDEDAADGEEIAETADVN